MKLIVFILFDAWYRLKKQKSLINAYLILCNNIKVYVAL